MTTLSRPAANRATPPARTATFSGDSEHPNSSVPFPNTVNCCVFASAASNRSVPPLTIKDEFIGGALDTTTRPMPALLKPAVTGPANVTVGPVVCSAPGLALPVNVKSFAPEIVSVPCTESGLAIVRAPPDDCSSADPTTFSTPVPSASSDPSTVIRSVAFDGWLIVTPPLNVLWFEISRRNLRMAPVLLSASEPAPAIGPERTATDVPLLPVVPAETSESFPSSFSGAAISNRLL